MISTKKQSFAFLFGGLLPVILFTVIEEKYGVVYGLIAAMIFSLGEIIYEKVKYKKVSFITWLGSLLILVMGAVSLVTQDGLWFKLQPAILEFVFFILLFGSYVIKKPFLLQMILKQQPSAPEGLLRLLPGMTLRLSIFFLLHAAVATYAAFYWSTEAWAILKGVGLTVTMVIYFVIEGFYIRRQLVKDNRTP